MILGNTGKYVHGSAFGNTGALKAGKTYHYRVFAIYENDGEGEPTAPVMATTQPAIAPAPPSGLTATATTLTANVDTTANTIQLSWTPPTGIATGASDITGYKIEGAMAGGAWQTLEEKFIGDDDTTDPTSVTVEYNHKKLTASTAWRYRVSSVNKVGTGMPTDPVGGRTAGGELPGQPTGLFAQGTSSNVIVTWQAPRDPPGAPITGYKIVRKVRDDNPDTEVNESVAADFSTVGKDTYAYVGRALAFVTSGGTRLNWQYSVSAINSVGTGQTSSFIGDHPNPAVALGVRPPNAQANSAVRNLRAVGFSQTEIRLSWEPPLRTASGSLTHRIQASADGRAFRDIGGGSDPAGTTFRHTGLKAGAKWYYRVTAISDAVHRSSPIVSGTTLDPRAPDAPTLEAAGVAVDTDDGASQINLDWTAPANGGATITSYKIERSADQIDWVTIVEAFDKIDSGAVATEYEDKGLSAGSTWYYRVRATKQRRHRGCIQYSNGYDERRRSAGHTIGPGGGGQRQFADRPVLADARGSGRRSHHRVPD